MYLVIVDLGNEEKKIRFFDNYANAQLFLIECGGPAMICYVNHVIHDDGLSKRLGWELV